MLTVVASPVPAVADAWARATSHLSPDTYRRFCAFVENVAPAVGCADDAQIRALLCTFAASCAPDAYPHDLRES